MNDHAGPPYKGFAPMQLVPGCNSPRDILLDFLHIYHISYGLDAAASSIMLLCKLGHFGTARKMDDRLEEAFSRFDIWCKNRRRSTSIDSFSTIGFGMAK